MAATPRSLCRLSQRLIRLPRAMLMTEIGFCRSGRRTDHQNAKARLSQWRTEICKAWPKAANGRVVEWEERWYLLDASTDTNGTDWKCEKKMLKRLVAEGTQREPRFNS
eukprot:scaffold2751_cov266-Pinguiococcus_pyrenoidosus.AAC.4